MIVVAALVMVVSTALPAGCAAPAVVSLALRATALVWPRRAARAWAPAVAG